MLCDIVAEYENPTMASECSLWHFPSVESVRSGAAMVQPGRAFYVILAK